MSDRLYIGLDSGTQGSKGVVLSENSRNIIAQASRSYDIMENIRGGREQDPSIWIGACKSIIIELLNDRRVNSAEIVALGVSGQQHGMVALDANDEVIRPAKLWCDTETVPQCETITERVGGKTAVVEQIGNQLSAGYTASKILWLKEHEPENYAKIKTILLPHDYINFWLTGNHITECGDASGTAYFDIRNRVWSDSLLNAIDGDAPLSEFLPKIIASDQPCGKIRPALADELGLPPNVLVSSGGGDNMIAAIGTGNVEPGIVTTSLGTSGTIYSYSDIPVVDPSGELAAFCSSTGGWLPLVCTMNVTVATEMVRSLLGKSLEDLNILISQTKPGSDGVILLPYFNGERTPDLPNATATLAGLTTQNMRPGALARAAMEGATFGLRYGLEVMKRNGIIPEEIRLVGGGAKSTVWRQLVADVFNCPVVCPVNDEAGATGAALQACWCYATETAGEKVSIVEITNNFIQLDDATRSDPSAAAVKVYDEVYKNFTTFNRLLEPNYELMCMKSLR